MNLFKKEKQIPVETNLSLGQLIKAISQEVNSLKPEAQAAELRDKLEVKGGQNPMTNPLIDHLDEALSSIIKASNTGDVDSEQAIRLLVAYEIIENVKCSL